MLAQPLQKSSRAGIPASAFPIVPFFLGLGLPVFLPEPALLLPFHLLNFLTCGVFVQMPGNLSLSVNHDCMAILICITQKLLQGGNILRLQQFG